MKFLLIVFSILVVHCIEISNGEEEPGPPEVPKPPNGLVENSTVIGQQIISEKAPTVKPAGSEAPPKKGKSKGTGKDSKKKKKKEKATPTTTTTPKPPPPPPPPEKGESEEDNNSRTPSESNSNEEEDRRNTEPKSNASEPVLKPESQDSEPKNDPGSVPEPKISESGTDAKQNKSEKIPPNNLDDSEQTLDGISATTPRVKDPALDSDSQNHIPGADGRRDPNLDQRIVGGYDQMGSGNEILPPIPSGGSSRSTIGDAFAGIPNVSPNANFSGGRGQPGLPGIFSGPQNGTSNVVPGAGGHPGEYPRPSGGLQNIYNRGQDYGRQINNHISDGLQNVGSSIQDIGNRIGDQLGHGTGSGSLDPKKEHDPSQSDQDGEHSITLGRNGPPSDSQGRLPDGGRHMLQPSRDRFPTDGRRGIYYDPKGGPPSADDRGNPGKKSNSDSDSNSDMDSQDGRNQGDDYDTYDEEGTQSDNGPEKQQENRGKGQTGNDQSKLPDGERQGNNHLNTGENEVLKPAGGKQQTNTPNRRPTESYESKGLPNTKGHKQNDITQYPGGPSSFPNHRTYPNQDYGNSGHRNSEETRNRIDRMVKSSDFGYGGGKSLSDRVGDFHWQGINGIRNLLTRPFGFAYGLRDRFEHGYNRFNPGIPGAHNGGRFPYSPIGGRDRNQRIPQNMEIPDDNTPLSWKDFQNPGVLKKIFEYLSEVMSKMQGIPARIKEAFKRMASSLSRSNSYE